MRLSGVRGSRVPSGEGVGAVSGDRAALSFSTVSVSRSPSILLRPLARRGGRRIGSRVWRRMAGAGVLGAGVLAAVSGFAALLFFVALSFGFVAGFGGVVGEFLAAVVDVFGEGAGGDVEQYGGDLVLSLRGEGGVGGEDGGGGVGDGFDVEVVDGAVGEGFGDGGVVCEPFSEGHLVGDVSFGEAYGFGVPAFDGGVAELQCESSSVCFGEHCQSCCGELCLGGVDVRESGHDVLVGQRVGCGEVPQLLHAREGTTAHRQERSGPSRTGDSRDIETTAHGL